MIAKINLITTALPKITMHPNNVTAAEGTGVVLRCKAIGNGTLTYHWMKESGSLPMNSISNGGQNLTLQNIAVDGSGQYFCKVDNGGNKVTSKRAQVTVRSQLLCKVII